MLRVVTRLPNRLIPQCRSASWSSQQPRLSSLNSTVSHQRGFANSPILYKKKDKGKKAPTTSDSQPSPVATSEDPFDLSQLQTGISAAASRLKDDLSKLRAGGRFNTATLEGLKVQLSKESHESVKLGDLAQVVPKGGRMVTVLAAEEEVSTYYPGRVNLLVGIGNTKWAISPCSTAYQTCHLSDCFFESVPDSPTGPSQPSPTQRPHSSADKRISRPKRQCCQASL